MRTATLVSGAHGHFFDYLDCFFQALADPEVTEIRQIEDGRLRRVRRRDASGRWIVEKFDEPTEV